MTEAPKRIWAWPHFDGWITGDWSANTYHDDRTVEYILATEHDRLKAERDAFHIEMDRLQTKAMGAVDAARAIEAYYVRLLAKKDVRIAELEAACNQSRLAFAGYVSAQSAIDALDRAAIKGDDNG